MEHRDREEVPGETESYALVLGSIFGIDYALHKADQFWERPRCRVCLCDFPAQAVRDLEECPVCEGPLGGGFFEISCGLGRRSMNPYSPESLELLASTRERISGCIRMQYARWEELQQRKLRRRKQVLIEAASAADP